MNILITLKKEEKVCHASMMHLFFSLCYVKIKKITPPPKNRCIGTRKDVRLGIQHECLNIQTNIQEIIL